VEAEAAARSRYRRLVATKSIGTTAAPPTARAAATTAVVDDVVVVVADDETTEKLSSHPEDDVVAAAVAVVRIAVCLRFGPAVAAATPPLFRLLSKRAAL